jgi:2-haloacid dehalogenase
MSGVAAGSPGPAASPTLVRDAVVFDVGGVLLDWSPRYLYRQLLPDEDAVTRFLAEVATTEWNHQMDLGRPWADAVDELAARFPDQADLVHAYYHRWGEMIRGEIPGTVAVLEELDRHGTPLYGLTNFSAEKFAAERAAYPWMQRFRGVVVSGEERVAKPDPAIYRLLLDRYHLDAASAVYVDDVPANVEAAVALGLTGLVFTSADRLRADLVTLGRLTAAGDHQT